MTAQRSFACIICPIGCDLTAATEGTGVVSVCGNACPRGEAYARSECIDPRRTLTSTIAVSGGVMKLVPVKTAREIPVQLLFPCMEIIRRACVSAPVRLGEVLIPDILGTGVPVIACMDVPARDGCGIY